MIALFSVMVAGLAMANRTQTGQFAAALRGNNREAREAADAGITYILSEWNRPENRGMFNSLQPISNWDTTNLALRNPCRDYLVPTLSATSELKGSKALDNNRSFRIVEVTFRDRAGNNSFTSSANGTNTSLPAGFEGNDVEQIDLVVEGTLQRGSTSTTALATRRLNLVGTLPPCGSKVSDSKGVFSYGGTNPGSTTTLSSIPTYWYQDGGILNSKSAEDINCTPLVTGTSATTCAAQTAGSPSIPVKGLNLSASEKASRNPPTIQSIAVAANRPGGNPPQAISISLSGNKNITLTGSESNCFIHEGAAHCNVSTISMSGTTRLTIDSTERPVYLYVSGTIDLDGTSDIFHIVRYKNGVLSSSGTAKDVLGGNYTNIAQFEEDAFRFQIRGNPAGTTSQTFSMNGTPTANLLYWAPNAHLTMGGSTNSTLSSALFVNSLNLSGGSNIKLISQPGSFGFNLGTPNEERKTVAARSAVFTKFF